MSSSLVGKKSKNNRRSSKQATSFRMGRVLAHQRGQVWYLRYSENGQPQQPRVGHDRELTTSTSAARRSTPSNATARQLPTW